MQKGDNVLINYGNNINKVATFLEKDGNKNLFQDVSGLFILTDSFIQQNSITLTVVED